MKNNYVWIDMEMSGLDPDNDVVLEIATIITNDKLEIIEEGPSYVIGQEESLLLKMDDWNTKHHKKSGLWDKVLASKTVLAEAEIGTLNFIQKHTLFNSNPLCGNSVWQDRSFLRNYMPKIVEHLHYRIVDVSTVKLLASNWLPKHPPFQKKNSHRALDDIRESINELAYFKNLLLNSPASDVK